MTFALRAVFVAMEAPAPQSIAFAIRGPIARDDLPGLCDRVCALLGASGAAVAFVDVPASSPTRCASTRSRGCSSGAKRHGCQRAAARTRRPTLRELVAFMGLADVLVEVPTDPP